MQKEQHHFTANLWRVLTNESENMIITVRIYEIKEIAIYEIIRYENGEDVESIAVNGSTNAWSVALGMLEEY